MDKNYTIPRYRVVCHYGDERGFEEKLNELALEGYEVCQYSIASSSSGKIHSAILVKRVSRLEALVKDNRVVK